MRTKVWIAAMLGLVLAQPLAGQGPPRGGMQGGGPPGGPPVATLVGIVVDSISGQPLATATVEVRAAADNSVVAGALTDGEGRFRIQGLMPGRYVVRAATLGYEALRVEDVALAPGAVRQLEPMRLSARAVALEGLEVTAERGLVRLEVDRTVFNARNLPAAAGGNATDVLRNVPSVEVDPDGRVTMRGSGDVVVQINGRPAPFRGDALAMFLRQMPAGAVDRVEVVANPSARYDPEGLSGIVNIVLRENTNLGLSAAITVAGSSAERFNGSSTVGYQAGPWNLAGMYSVNSDLRNPSLSMERVNRLRELDEVVQQDTRNRQESLGHTLLGSVDRRLTEATSLSLQASGSLSDSDASARNSFRSSRGGAWREWSSATGTDRSLRSGEVTAGLRSSADQGRRASSVEARFSTASDAWDARFGNAFLDVLRETQRNETGTRDLSLQADATRMLGGVRVEVGGRGEQRLMDTELAVRGAAGDDDVARSNAFDFDERIYAAYLMASRPLGRLSVQGGARVEHADTRFTLRTLGENYDNSYSSLYPSASVLYDGGSGRSVRAGWSRRVQRPRTSQLNPFPLQEDSLTLLMGNPTLRPQYTNSFDVTLQATGALGTLQVVPFHRRTSNLIRPFRRVNPESGVTVTTFQNLASSIQTGVEATATGRLGSRLSGMVGGSAAQVATSAENLQVGLSSTALSWSVRTSTSLRLAQNTDAQAFVMYRAPMRIEQGRMREFMVSNVSVRQRVLEGRGEAVLRVSDPLGRMRFGFFTSDEFHEQDFLRNIDARSAVLSFSYSVGRPPRLRARAAEEPEMEIR
jgi:outer membrane receptor protein involved in Fe transport